MRNRVWVFLVGFVVIGLLSTKKLSAQLTLTSGSTVEWIGVSSYNGITKVNGAQFRLKAQGRNDSIQNWKLAVRVGPNSTISNGEADKNGIKKEINPSRVKIRINRIVAVESSALIPTYSNQEFILSTSDVILLSEANTANAQIKNSGYENNKDYTFYFDIIIEGGSYLQNLFSYTSYNMELTFSILGPGGTLTEASYLSGIQIAPSGIPPSGPEFGFEVNANATLNFTTPEDYTNQVENNPNSSWLKVTSKNTPYIVRVKTNSTDFTGDKGTVPVNVVSMKADGPTNSASGAAILAVPLSTNEQVVYRGKATGTNSHLLDVRYFITEIEAGKLATKTPGQYSTTLTYTLTPP